jgi:hypothetical protein
LLAAAGAQSAAIAAGDADRLDALLAEKDRLLAALCALSRRRGGSDGSDGGGSDATAAAGTIRSCGRSPRRCRNRMPSRKRRCASRRRSSRTARRGAHAPRRGHAFATNASSADYPGRNAGPAPRFLDRQG